MSLRRMQTGLLFGITLLLVLALASSALAAAGRSLPSSTPSIVNSARNLGPENSSTVINMTFWMQVRNQAALDQLTRDIYTKGSPNYHKFLTLEQYKSQFAVGDREVQVVKDFAKASGFEVVSVSKANLAVQVKGTIGEAQKAFHVQINRYDNNGKTFHAPDVAPSMDGEAAVYVAAVSGLHNLGAKPNSVRPTDPDTGQPYPGRQLTSQDLAKHAPSVLAKQVVHTPGIFYEDQCWRGVQTQSFTTNNNLPAAVYSGNRYGSDPGSPPPHLPPCGYEPLAALTAYQMLPLFGAGATGAGQTLVIVDAFDWPTLTADLTTFSGIFGLPNPPSFTIYQPEGPPPFDSGWGGEESIDLQWGHTMAPLANLALVEGIDNSFNSLNNAILFAIEAGLGNVISNSYGAPEALVDSGSLDTMNAICQLAATLGISVDFSSGDSGDYVAAAGVKTVSYGADSPYATGVGGVSVFLNPDDSIKFQTGWGTQLTKIGTSTGKPVIPTLNEGFIYGAGGGTSGFFAKPSFQSGLPGAWRKVPDTALIGDPYTGVEIIFSPCGDPSCQTVEVFGGTSVACPMFSGLWTDINEITVFSFGIPAGQAAPYTYFVPAGSQWDVVNLTSPTNVAGSIFTGGPPSYQSPAGLMAPLDGVSKFVSAFYHSPHSHSWFVEGYGLDSSLDAAPGWDNVTGNGTPNGINFAIGVLSIFP